MATTAGDIYVRSGASGSFTDVEYVRGGWITVPSESSMRTIYHDRLDDGQIIYIQQDNSLHLTTKYRAFVTPGYAGTTDSASFSKFYFPTASAAGGASNDGIFKQTGSIYSTTNNLQITGSLSVRTSAAEDVFIIKSSSFEAMKVNANGVLVLGSHPTLPPAVAGGLVYSGSSFYLGYD